MIAAGNTTGTVTLTAVQDALDETNETIVVDISGVTNGTESGTQQVTATITDDDGVNTPDTDGDGLFDTWETNGIDTNLDGIIDLDLPAMGAKPDHRDLFVEADYMVGIVPGESSRRSFRPFDETIFDLQYSFAAAPVANPDGTTGIRLHILIDEAVPLRSAILFQTRGPGSGDDFDDIKLGSNSPTDPGNALGTRSVDGHFGTVADRSSSNCANILAARRESFRYAVFGSTYAEFPGSSGISELPGNDFLVTVGSWTDADIKATGGSKNLAVARRNVEAGTFMHEFGHALNLRHGGGDDTNREPNYLSVMNYDFQFPYLDATRPLDFCAKQYPISTRTALMNRPESAARPVVLAFTDPQKSAKTSSNLTRTSRLI